MAGRSGSPIVWGFLHKDVRTKTMAEPFKYNSFTNSKKKNTNLTQSTPNTKTCTNTLSQPANKLFPNSNSSYHILRNTHVRRDNKNLRQVNHGVVSTQTDANPTQYTIILMYPK